MAYECYKGTPPYYDLDDYQALSMITRDGVEPLIKKLSSATELFRKFLTRYVSFWWLKFFSNAMIYHISLEIKFGYLANGEFATFEPRSLLYF